MHSPYVAVKTSPYLQFQHCSCFRDVVITQILGLHCIEVSSYNSCHQMSYFTAQIHQIRFRLGFICSRACWGSFNYSAPQTHVAEFKGAYF